LHAADREPGPRPQHRLAPPRDRCHPRV